MSKPQDGDVSKMESAGMETVEVLSIVQKGTGLVDIRDMPTAIELKSGIASVLAEYENNRERVAGERRVDEIWDQCSRVDDTNQKVLTLLNQCFVMFQASYDKFMASQKEGEEYVRRLKREAVEATSASEKGFEKKARMAEIEAERIAAQADAHMKNLRAFAKTTTDLAHEYRACRTQAAYFIHISQVQQFMGLIIAVLHQQIHDAGVLKKVSEAIESASLKLFPQERTQDS